MATYLKEGGAGAGEISTAVRESVRDILDAVRERGDDAVREFTERFDGVNRDDHRVTGTELADARAALGDGEREAIDHTIANVERFHAEQFEHVEGFETEVREGVTLGQRVLPVESAGVYVPGGRHPLVATPAMTVVPATVAGVERVVACVPPGPDGSPQPAQLYALDEAGADEIRVIGGAQAVGAMAFGTETLDPVAKVCGPGNVYTTEAKRQVFGRVGVDLLAGPTEVLIVTDGTADADLVATDLLAQAEHDPNSRAVLVALEEDLARATVDSVEKRLPALETEATARACWADNGEVVVADSEAEAAALADDYAMEHVQVLTADPRAFMERIENYGSLFLGEHAPVVFGDKTVGTNHCLPTGRAARYTSGIWVGTYLKTPTHQQLTREGAAAVAPWAARICEIEGTHAHRLSAEARLSEESAERDAEAGDDSDDAGAGE
jgi:histidinol dehydrogenase/sulfopropanediol 3-dehydrogenase